MLTTKENTTQESNEEIKIINYVEIQKEKDSKLNETIDNMETKETNINDLDSKNLQIDETKENIESNLDNTDEKPVIKEDSNIESKNNEDYEKNIDSARQDLIEEIISIKPAKKQKKQKKKKQRIKKYNIDFSYILYSKRLFIGVCIFACVVGLYSGYLLFGSSSVETLLKLRNKRDTLAKEVEEAKIQNALLQKKVLELLSLEPDGL